MSETILIIDDDPHLRGLMQMTLSMSGYNAMTATNGMEGLRLLQQHQPDLVLLDIMMPDVDGWEVCQHIREVSTVPIIFLTARQAAHDMVKGLNLGADDYVVKPFHQDELQARINVALRRARAPSFPSPKPPLRFGNGDLIINTSTHSVTARSRLVELTPTEYRLLLCLAEQPGRVLTTRQIYDAVWSEEANTTSASVQWHIWRLRGKIECDPAKPRFILTVPGIGYRFSAD